ncbi:MAG TPA: hypothetical protein VLS94_00630 [Fusibacter sp.]|nr:hypothetical protein [Fusibacter sp.]
MVTIIQGASKKPVSAQRLADFFAACTTYDGFLYIGYPIIGTAEGAYPIDAIFVSKSKGLVVFNFVEGREVDIESIKEAQDDSYNNDKLESKLRAHKILLSDRKLQIDIHPITFAPVCVDAP